MAVPTPYRDIPVAPRLPLLELFNHFRPFILAESLALLGLATFTQSRALVTSCTVLVLASLALFVFALQGGTASATPGSRRLLRVVTLNLWIGNERMDLVANFLRQTNGDLLAIEEVAPQQAAQLTNLLSELYPHATAFGGILLLSKLPPIDTGHQNGPGKDGWARVPLILWAKFDKDGSMFEFAGVHTAWPFNPIDHVVDTDALIAFSKSQAPPLILAGDFNLTPWSLKLQRLTRETELGRADTFQFTWPINRLFPFVAIDHVFVSRQFALQSFAAGPYVGSDHRPIIADIALARPDKMAASEGTDNPN